MFSLKLQPNKHKKWIQHFQNSIPSLFPWTLLGWIFIDEIMSACQWATHNTFTSYYLQLLAWKNADGFSPGTKVAAPGISLFFPKSQT